MPLEKIIDVCSGCGACAAICPFGAIIVAEDPNGFLKPVIDSALCVNCGLCEKRCPLMHRVSLDAEQITPPKVYAAYNLDDDIRMKSTSGGIFDILAREVLSQGGVVYGAVFEEDWSVSQRGIESEEDIEALRYSKYVQSHPRSTFAEVKANLKAERKVLYVSTPCMIGGLLSFLGQRDENLVTCSFICGANVSRKVWGRYVAYCEKNAGQRLQAVCFRDKRTGWMRSSFIQKYGNEERVVRNRWYLSGFYKKLTTIGCCVSCEFRGEEQLADIMLADFWGVEEWRPELAQDQKGVSCVLIHTRRGGDLFTRCKPKMYEEKAPLDLVRRRNKGLVAKKGIPHEKRADFFADLDQLPMGKIIKKYRVSPTLFERVISKVKRMILKVFKR